MAGKFWSLFFAGVSIYAIGTFLFYALATPMGLLPPNVNLRSESLWIDHLFWLILWVTTFVFVLTAVAQAWFFWRYAENGSGRRAVYLHGSYKMELAWTLIPAVALFALGVYQLDAWASAKTRIPQVSVPVAPGEQPMTIAKAPLAEVTGRQFAWRFRYAGPDGRIGTRDDLFTVNELHVPSGEEIVLTIKSEDVLHSFYLPQMRVKQDIVPGMKQFVWFEAKQVDPVADRYDIVCTELCGWGHYKMRGRLVVQPRADYDAWFAEAFAAQELSAFDPAADDAAATVVGQARPDDGSATSEPASDPETASPQTTDPLPTENE